MRVFKRHIKGRMIVIDTIPGKKQMRRCLCACGAEVVKHASGLTDRSRCGWACPIGPLLTPEIEEGRALDYAEQIKVVL